MHRKSLRTPLKCEAKGKGPLQTEAKSFPSYLRKPVEVFPAQRGESGFAPVSPPGDSEAQEEWVADLARVLATEHRSFLGTHSPSADSAVESSPGQLHPAAHSLPLNHPLQLAPPSSSPASRRTNRAVSHSQVEPGKLPLSEGSGSSASQASSLTPSGISQEHNEKMTGRQAWPNQVRVICQEMQR